MAQTDSLTFRQPIRVWPGVVAAALIVLMRYLVPLAEPEWTIFGILTAMGGALIILVWWIFFSRAPWYERLGAVLLMAVLPLAFRPFLHPSITGGMMGNMFAVYALPSTVTIGFVLWAVATRRVTSRTIRLVTMAAAIALGCAVWMLARTDGVTGSGISQLTWRWTPTPEERLLAQGGDPASLPPAAPLAPAANAAPAAATDVPASPTPSPAANPAPAAPPAAATVPSEPRATAGSAPGEPGTTRVRSGAEWEGFRGPNRDSVIRGLRIETDWAKSPPVQLWRRPVGPGWSSFAVLGDRFYTQEQRGDDEIVACYRLGTGEPLWAHRDSARFWESNGGAGPRGTPTLSNGRVYALGATGILNVLDADTGARVWSRNVAADAEKQVPMWGFSSSPLVHGDLVIVAAAGKLAAYDLATGKPRWFGPNGGGYSSPHLMTIAGVEQVVFQSSTGAMGFAPADGTKLWEYTWEGTPIVQPAAVGGGDVLIASGDMMGGMGLRRVALAKGPSAWSAQERWVSRGLKPYFNDFVVHEGHAYGFDGTILSCVSVEDGARKWKGGRYGQGQLVLLADQDLMLILSEDGELALVSAVPDGYTEVARAPAIAGKTWNHPVLVGDVLLVRNSEEMAAFRLASRRQ